MAGAIMFQGTGSDVGKSLIVAGLCRLFSQRGLKVRPFKPQNMSNNAAVTVDGGEIGRAQALQARAARVLPTTDMNPVLLKPQTDIGSQIVINGKIWGTAKAREYQTLKAQFLPAILQSFERLRAEADLVLIEGAGSASEVNLRQGDIANMGFAQAARVPVVLIGDIDRGGVIASLVGTKAVVSPSDAALIHGFIVNRMRGDASLFADGMDFIAQRTGWAKIGLVPHLLQAALLPAEDALQLSSMTRSARNGGTVKVAVFVLPRIANFDDLDPLIHDPRFDVVMLRHGEPLPPDTQLLILPGAKATIADMQSLRAWGWEHDLHAHVRRGGHVLGLCGGYQMLGRMIDDPHGVEGPAGAVEGLGLLDVETVLTPEKSLVGVEGVTLVDGVPFTGYEMHIGATRGRDCDRSVVKIGQNRVDGAMSADGRVLGTYVHGLFANDRQRDAWAEKFHASGGSYNYEAAVESALDVLATHLERYVDVEAILSLAMRQGSA